MRVLVTGASGFVCANVVEALCAVGHAVVAFDRPGARRPSLEPGFAPPAFIAADIRDREACMAAVRGCDAVIHGAAATPVDRSDIAPARQAIDVNLSGTVNIVEACEAVGAHLVYLGSASVYGTTEDDPLDEDATPCRPAAPYAISKWAAERFAIGRARHGLRVSALRLGSVFGPHERDTGMRDTISAIYQVTAAALRGETVILPRPGRRDWIYARDIAAAILGLIAMDTPLRGPINLGFGAEWSVADWCESLSRRLNFSWRIDPRVPTIDFHGGRDRPPLATLRMREVLGFKPAYDRERACEDYLQWLARQEVS